MRMLKLRTAFPIAIIKNVEMIDVVVYVVTVAQVFVILRRDAAVTLAPAAAWVRPALAAALSRAAAVKAMSAAVT
ncbi:hypothetical protein KJ940_01660, partial [Myxococcota bacterium]|nr:hypothetical protein [Myxococcota bacterium]